MTTKRKKSKGTAAVGVNYVRQIVEGDNSIFQTVNEDNDIGNDAYIEFVVDEEATGCFVWVQIKSGISYKRKNHYAISADKDHFEYWNSHIVPVIGIVYDPEIQSAFWINISEYIKENSSAVKDNSHTLCISPLNELNAKTFSTFKKLFLEKHTSYKGLENFGRALEYFAMVDQADKCFDGLLTLFVSYRNKRASWFYMINSFSSIEDRKSLFQLVSYLSLLSGHMDIFWHPKNFIDAEVIEYAKVHLAKDFNILEVVKLLSIVDDWGFSRGSIGYATFTIISLINNKTSLLEKIAFDNSLSDLMRSNALFLLIHFEQFDSTKKCINLINRYLKKYSDTEYEEVISSMKEIIEIEGFLGYIG
ncbi:DUF4365 domain-containing protein [Leptolyngbya sp. NIES-2104]|uniref:DUF4365 domain-containing protein n=1 Tax=Leptolyngbya sp. NIES-2104 TaxID=1552121 RepID=UPI0006EC611C|nr:DUF4365 domain-containing protein [Leptolyngbya sp. NIES-2104]GAP99419.1 hypothetical protein NIES2104_59800 [Leptolyngbya sp. NIES-2104]